MRQCCLLNGSKNPCFLGELNGSKAWSTDIGNAHLEMHTKEKVHIVAGPEFGDCEGHVLVRDAEASRVTSSRPGTAVHPKEQDARSKVEHSKGTK